MNQEQIDGMAREFALERGFDVATAAELDRLLQRPANEREFTQAWMYRLQWAATKEWAEKYECN